MVGDVITWWSLYDYLVTFILAGITIKIYAPDYFKFFILIRFFYLPRYSSWDDVSDEYFTIACLTVIFLNFALLKFVLKNHIKMFFLFEIFYLIEDIVPVEFYVNATAVLSFNICISTLYYKKLNRFQVVLIFIASIYMTEIIFSWGYPIFMIILNYIINSWYFINYVLWFYNTYIEYNFKYLNNWLLEYYQNKDFLPLLLFPTDFLNRFEVFRDYVEFFARTRPKGTYEDYCLTAWDDLEDSEEHWFICWLGDVMEEVCMTIDFFKKLFK